MGTFCFDQYEHPLLWCDEKKRDVEKKNAEESIISWRRKKTEEFIKRERDKKEYNEMFHKHCPWGRPGGGAPNLDVRMRNITAEGLHPIPKCYPVCAQPYRTSALPPCRYESELKDGSKIKSAADRLYITLKDHPSMTLRNKGHLDIELRYKASPKAKQKMKLDKIVVTEEPKCKVKSKKKKHDDPWGKPGPGGTPWRNPKTVGSSFMRSLGWTNKELLKELDQDNPQTTASEKTPMRPPVPPGPMHKKLSPPRKSELKGCCPTCTCKCRTISTTASTLDPTRGSPHKKRSSKDFGGGGGELSEEKIPHERIDRLCRQQNVPKGPTTSGFGKSAMCGGGGGGNNGVELVPLLARRRGMHRPISLSSTDVTKRTDKNRFTTQDMELLRELKRQICYKRRQTRFNHQMEAEQSHQHFQTFDTYWGRPGYGAPKGLNNNKLNLDDLLYGVSVE